jgi:hypothetical protein
MVDAPSIMTCNGNPKPVQFIQPNVLDGACLSVRKHDGFADQFGLRRTYSSRIFDARRFTDPSMSGQATCAVQSGSMTTLGPRRGDDGGPSRKPDSLRPRRRGGEFFQIYTHTFDERSFFEIVQRRNYQGSGAANAAVCLAAQIRESRLLIIPRA